MCLSFPWPLFTRRMRTLVVCLLLGALPIYGASGVLLQLLGAPHRHQAVDVPASGGSLLDGLLARVLGPSTMELVSEFHAQQNLGVQKLHRHADGHVHSHGLFERHHHDAGDPSVVSLGAATPVGDLGDDSASAAVGSATLALGLAGDFVFPAFASVAGPWPVQGSAAWRSRHHAPPERPPRPAALPAIDGQVTGLG